MNLQSSNDNKFEGVLMMTLTVNDVQSEDAGTYRCVVTNGAGHNVTSNQATLTVGKYHNLTKTFMISAIFRLILKVY